MILKKKLASLNFKKYIYFPKNFILFNGKDLKEIIVLFYACWIIKNFSRIAK